MDTELTEVIVKNFGPFVGEHRLTIADASLTFVKGRNEAEPRLGPNGAGKSKLLNAIPWCLYGRTSDDLAATDIRPWSGKGQTSVTIKLTSWDGNEGARHTITRTAGPNSLTLDGKPCATADIEALIGMSLAVFRLAPFLGQGQPLFHDLPNREKLDFLVSVLKLDRWDDYSDRARDKAGAISRELAGIEGQIVGMDASAAALATQVTRQKEHVDSWEAERGKQLKDATKAVAKLKKSVSEASAAHEALKLKLDGVGLTLKLTAADARKAFTAMSAADHAFRAATSAQRRLEDDHERATAELAALKSAKQCPTCGQTIKREAKYLDNVAHVEGEIRKYAAALKCTVVRDAKRAHDKAVAAYDALAKQEKQQRDAEAALSREEALASRTRLELEVDLRHATTRVDEYEGTENPHRARLAELRRSHKQLLDERSTLGSKLVKLEVELSRTSYWIKGFKDVRLYLLQDVLDELEFATNAMLDDMGLVGWEVRYDVERDTKAGTVQRGLVITVLSPQRSADVKWKSWSGGEGQRLRIAGALALSEVVLARAGVACNVEVLDEPTRHLSSEGVDDLCEFLSARARTHKKSIFLVDHMAIESSYFDRIITVRKTDKGSSIKG